MKGPSPYSLAKWPLKNTKKKKKKKKKKERREKRVGGF
jgi:hypothetical protein